MSHRATCHGVLHGYKHTCQVQNWATFSTYTWSVRRNDALSAVCYTNMGCSCTWSQQYASTPRPCIWPIKESIKRGFSMLKLPNSGSYVFVYFRCSVNTQALQCSNTSCASSREPCSARVCTFVIYRRICIVYLPAAWCGAPASHRFLNGWTDFISVRHTEKRSDAKGHSSWRGFATWNLQDWTSSKQCYTM